MAWRVEVIVHGQWCGSIVRFATEDEALAYGDDMVSNRWRAAEDFRAVQCNGIVNSRWDGRLERVH
jgi:hypothetical protein